MILHRPSSRSRRKCSPRRDNSASHELAAPNEGGWLRLGELGHSATSGRVRFEAAVRVLALPFDAAMTLARHFPVHSVPGFGVSR